MKNENRIPMVATMVAVAVFHVAFAQTPSDLGNPKLKANASLPQHNPPGMQLSQTLATARATAPSKGVSWKGMDITASDDESLTPSVPLSSALLAIYPKQACEADSIVVGHPNSSLFHLSASGTAIYGDYLFSINTLLKDNRISSIRSSPDLIITRPGGSMTLPDGPVNFDLRQFPRLQPTTTYLVFLRYLPQSSSYQAIDSLSTLVANGNNWMVARAAFSGIVIPGFTHGVLEKTIGRWLTTCN